MEHEYDPHPDEWPLWLRLLPFVIVAVGFLANMPGRM